MAATATRALLLLAIAAAAAAVATAQNTLPTPAPNSVVIVGAGISGLSAADALCARGFTVTVLEGRARTGGRTYTAKLPLTNTQVEVGAGWIHDADPTRNSVAEFVQENGLATILDQDEELAWLVNKPVPAPAVAQPSKTLAWQATAEGFEELLQKAETTWPVNQNLQKQFDDWAKKEQLTGDDLAGVRAILASDAGDLEYGASMNQINARYASEGEQGDGEERLIAKGYSALIAVLEARIKAQPTCKNAINLNARVSEIRTVSSPAAKRGIHVRLANGTVVAGKFGITTLPLGVLKAGAVQFNPPLTQEKQAAMDKLGMGVLNKVALVYDEAFWSAPGAGGGAAPEELSWYVPVYSASNKSPPAEGTGLEFWNHDAFFKDSHAVVMLLGGDTAVKWEALHAGQPPSERDRLVAQKADALFRQLFPSSTAELREYFVTRWAADPWSRGAYSYMRVGGNPQLRTKLCAPQSGLLYFAGEHCSVTLPSTAPGARDTGLAAVDEALKKFPAPKARR